MKQRGEKKINKETRIAMSVTAISVITTLIAYLIIIF